MPQEAKTIPEHQPNHTNVPNSEVSSKLKATPETEPSDADVPEQEKVTRCGCRVELLNELPCESLLTLTSMYLFLFCIPGKFSFKQWRR
ncbi:hypothetical protein AVEN_212606-1 [Araneus ventricosus]|uniref:Uncharacterized protein n=1 Tax=Araneus ventricosus TaxID=182803 RepID=A0A4Y1ZUP3_ARAVE|nr:hypothetical protein AVEN_212606-1 [Araneus ventricosus]